MSEDVNAVYYRLPKTGWLEFDEAELLYEKALESKGPILEVGSYYGRSTYLLASAGKPVYSVDPYIHTKSPYEGSKENVQKAITSLETVLARFPNVMHFRVPISQWEPRPCGLCYLDGDHTKGGTITQINVAKLCKIPDSKDPLIIAIHDVVLNPRRERSPTRKTVSKEALKALGNPNKHVGYLGVWYIG